MVFGLEFGLLALIAHLLHPLNKPLLQLGFDFGIPPIACQVDPLIRVFCYIVEFFAGSFLVAADLLGGVGIVCGLCLS